MLLDLRCTSPLALGFGALDTNELKTASFADKGTVALVSVATASCGG
jgi:hypothetical protein